MNWGSNGFLGIYAEWLEADMKTPPEDKLETIKKLRIEKFEGKRKKAGQGNPAERDIIIRDPKRKRK